MNGISGYHAWRWIFILEGILTSIIGFASYFMVPDFPENSSWLTTDEQAYIKARLAAEQDPTPIEDQSAEKHFLLILKDRQVLLGGLIYFALIVPAYSNYAPIHTSLFRLPADLFPRLQLFRPHRNQYLQLHPYRNPAAHRPTQRRCLFFRSANRSAFRRHSPSFPVRLFRYPPRPSWHCHPFCRRPQCTH